MGSNLAFFFNTVPSDYLLALRLIKLIRQYHPESQIVAIPDGHSAYFEAINPGCIVAQREYPLKRKGTVHIHTLETFRVALTHTQADILIQLDPDAYITQPFKPFPDTPIFGQLVKDFGWDDGLRGVLLHGACWGMRREAMEQLVAANPFKAGNYELWWQDRERKNDEVFEDPGMSRSIAAVIPSSDWGEWPGLLLRNGNQSLNIRRGETSVVHPNLTKGLDEIRKEYGIYNSARRPHVIGQPKWTHIKR